MLTSLQSNVFPSRGAKGSSLTARFELDPVDASSGFLLPDSISDTTAVSSAGVVIVTFVFVQGYFFCFVWFCLIYVMTGWGGDRKIGCGKSFCLFCEKNKKRKSFSHFGVEGVLVKQKRHLMLMFCELLLEVVTAVFSLTSYCSKFHILHSLHSLPRIHLFTPFSDTFTNEPNEQWLANLGSPRRSFMTTSKTKENNTKIVRKIYSSFFLLSIFQKPRGLLHCDHKVGVW